MSRIRNMDVYRDIIHRLRQHQSVRAIHRDTNAHRTIIRKAKQIGNANGWLNPSNPMPDNEVLQIAFSEKQEKRIDSRSNLQPFFDQIRDWNLQGHSPTVIYQLLRERCSTSPRSVQRFIKNHFPRPVEPIMLRESIPGETADVDYGYLGIIYDPDEKRNRKAWVFSMRLRYSRRAYRQLSFDQSSKNFLMAHIHAFEFFGAVPEKVVLDNLKAGVIQANPFEPLLNKSYIALAEHYGFVISPCSPRTPQHKGGVENDIKYIKNNFWPFFCAGQQEKGKDIPCAKELTSALSSWGQEIADKRKTLVACYTPQELFLKDFEKMKPLPSNRWDFVEWSATVVGLDWRVRYDNTFYSVPAHLISQKVWICAGMNTIKIFHENIEVANHPRSYIKGAFQRKTEHAPAYLENVWKTNKEGLEILAEKRGGAIEIVIKKLLSHPVKDRLHAARRIFDLEKAFGQIRLEAACKRSLYFGEAEYSNVKSILERGLDFEKLKSEEPPQVGEEEVFEFCRTQEQYQI